VLEALARRDPHHAGAQLGLGIQYARTGEVERAVAALQRCVQLAPDAFAAHAALGEIARRREDHRRAAESFAAAVRLDPGFAEGYLHAANAYSKLQNYRRARPLAEEYAGRRPRDWRGPFLLGMVSSGEGKMAEALSHYEEAVRRAPEHAPAYLNAGATFLYGSATPERLAAAASWFERGVQVAPRYPELYYYLGLVRYRQRRWQEASAALREAVTQQPALGEAYYPLAQSLRRLGRDREAALCLQLYNRLRAKP
jgi:tetratricopeptide (TPR) repeat protein